MTANTDSKVLIAIIGAITSIIVAAITTYGTIYFSKSEIFQTKQKIEEMSQIERIANLPIGTIVPSLLPPALFAKEVGDPSTFDPINSKWVLADSKKDITLSKYGELFNNEKETPDLRGMFLRGMNEGRDDGNEDPEQNRQIGEYQPDTVKSHNHEYAVQTKGGNIAPSKNNYNVSLMSDGNGFTFFNKTDQNDNNQKYPETRPKNVSVYFYIKIN